MFDATVFAIICGIIVYIIIQLGFAKTFAFIAEMKGHPGKPYFLLTFIFGIVGMLAVIALPAMTDTDKFYKPDLFYKKKATKLPPAENIFAQNKQTSSAPTTKRCPYCGEAVKNGRCEMCGKEVK